MMAEHPIALLVVVLAVVLGTVEVLLLAVSGRAAVGCASGR
ncbi:MAG: hypothetical protein WCL44_05095 [bacterium]